MITDTIQLWEARPYVTLHSYVLHDSAEFQSGRKRPAVIVCPGGAYLGTSDREAEPVALRFNANGIHAFVLRYTTYYQEWVSDWSNPPEGNPESRYPQPLLDLAKAILTVRENADTYNVDPDQIMVCGFSAGGHLAASLGVHWASDLLRDTFSKDSESFKPNGLILGYPLLDYLTMKELNAANGNPMVHGLFEVSNRAVFGNPSPSEEELTALSPTRHVSSSTPPTFLWHTAEDGLVYVQNSLLFAAELAKHGVPFDLHVFEKGDHGLALADKTTAAEPNHVNPHAASWMDLAISWLGLRSEQ